MSSISYGSKGPQNIYVEKESSSSCLSTSQIRSVDTHKKHNIYIYMYRIHHNNREVTFGVPTVCSAYSTEYVPAHQSLGFILELLGCVLKAKVFIAILLSWLHP